MKSTLSAIAAEITEVLAAQPNGTVSWSSGVSVLEEVSKTDKTKVWWVRCDAPGSLLSSRAIESLQAENVILGGPMPQRKKAGRQTVLAWALSVSKLLAAIKRVTGESSKLIILERRTRDLEQQLRAAREENASEHASAQLMHTLDVLFKTKAVPKLQKFVRRKPQKGKSLGGVPTLFLSDWHWGEVVDPKQVEGMNEYNLDIANERADRVVNAAMETLFHHQSGLSYDGLVCALGGDMFSGNIMEELRVTNQAPVLECLLDLANKVSSAILEMADNFPGVYVPAVPGNHGRIDKKTSTKNAVKDNYDWLLYQFVAKFVQAKLGDNCNVTFDISEALDMRFRIYGTKYLLTHGDRIKDSTTNGGFWPSLVEISRRKQQRAIQSGAENFDYMMCGHFHKYAAFSDVIVNGSLKGYDEYVYSNTFDIERPAQALWITHPDHKIVSHTRIYADDPEIDSMHNLPPISFGPAEKRSR